MLIEMKPVWGVSAILVLAVLVCAQDTSTTAQLPQCADGHLSCGTALREKGDVDGAIAEFRTAIRLNPNDANAHFGLGLGLEMKGQLNEALDEYRSAMTLDPKLLDGMAKTRYEKLAAPRGLYRMFIGEENAR